MSPTSREATSRPIGSRAEPREQLIPRAHAGYGLAALLLLALAIALAAPGRELVPGAGLEPPDWLLGPFGEGFRLAPAAYLTLLYLSIGLWVAVWLGAERLPRRPLLALAGGLLALFALAPPLLSLDLFSYISYGRLATEAGLNPYEAVPADLPASDEAASRVEDFRFTPSVYGPLFTLLSYPLAAAGVPLALWSLKAVALAAAVAIGVAVARLARLRGVDPLAAALFVLANPLVLVHVLGGAHYDGLMVALALWGLVAVLGGREGIGAAGLVAAVATKASGALYVPFALLGAVRPARLVAYLLALGAAVAGVALAAYGVAVTEAVGVASGNQGTVSRWSVPATLSRATGLDLDALRLALALAYGLAVAGLLAWVWRGADWLRAAGWAAAGLLAASSWMVPWYLIWLLPLAAVSRDRALLAVAIALTLLQAPNAVPV